jgi:hypothetical protein
MLDSGGEPELAAAVWRAARARLLAIPAGPLAQLLEGHRDLLVRDIEDFLLAGLDSLEQGTEPVVDDVLVSAVAASRQLYSTAVAVLQSYILDHSVDPRLVGLFQQFCSAVLSQAAAPEQLFPPRLQALALLLLAWLDLQAEGGPELAAAISRRLEPRSLEQRVLLLQFPAVLPHLDLLRSQL